MILDHIDKLLLPNDHCYGNEVHTLNTLAGGLAFLNAQVGGIEQKARGMLRDDIRVFLYGNDPKLAWIPTDLVVCAFHWYAVSVCNYVWLAGWLAQQVGATTTDSRDYAETVIPAVVTYRHKVGAHLARVFPRRDDTPADRMGSVMLPAVLDGDAFWAGAWTIVITTGEQLFSTTHDMRWSLTKTHVELAKRYWPEAGRES